MESEWVIVASFTDEVLCQIAVDKLDEEDIDAVVIDKRDSMYRIGEMDLCVHRDYVIAAKQLLKDIIS